MESSTFLLDELARRVADVVVERLRGPSDSDLIDQSASPLGPRRHIKAVRRRMSDGQVGASRVGRRYLLTREALDQELARVVEAPESPVNDVRSESERELRLVRDLDVRRAEATATVGAPPHQSIP